MSYILSKHFTLAEFMESNTATYYRISNVPPEECMPLAEEFCDRILEPTRELWGAVRITSGFRCAELNRLVGGTQKSDHQWTAKRIAADFDTPQANLDEVFRWLRLVSQLPFRQVIREHGSARGGDCIHISYPARDGQREALVGQTHGAGGYQRVEVA